MPANKAEEQRLIQASRAMIEQMNKLLEKAGSNLQFCPHPVSSPDQCPDQPGEPNSDGSVASPTS